MLWPAPQRRPAQSSTARLCVMACSKRVLPSRTLPDELLPALDHEEVTRPMCEIRSLVRLSANRASWWSTGKCPSRSPSSATCRPRCKYCPAWRVLRVDQHSSVGREDDVHVIDGCVELAAHGIDHATATKIKRCRCKLLTEHRDAVERRHLRLKLHAARCACASS